MDSKMPTAFNMIFFPLDPRGPLADPNPRPGNDLGQPGPDPAPDLTPCRPWTYDEQGLDFTENSPYSGKNVRVSG